MRGILFWGHAFGNAFSGGDKHFAKFIEYSKWENKVVCSLSAKKIVEKSKSEFYITDKGETSNPIIKVLTMFYRTIVSIREGRKKEYNFCLTSSPFFFDVIPMAFSKSQVKIANIFHVVPKRKSVNLKTFIRFKFAKFEQKISYFLIRICSDIILTGNSLEKEKLERIFPYKKILIEDGGIETEKMDFDSKGVKKKNQAIFTGRLTSQKGIFDLIKIVKKITSVDNKFKLFILGDGPDKEEFIKKIREAGLERNIILKGFIDGKEKNVLLAESKYFFFPSYEEGWGISLGEALYAKCICFCYELPHYKKIFSNFPIYVNLGNTNEFYEKFLKFNGGKKLEVQKKFMKKYDFKKVIRELESQFSSNKT